MGLYSSIDLVYDSDIVMGTIPVPEYGKKKKKIPSLGSPVSHLPHKVLGS